MADALVERDWRDRGLLDTAVVTVRFDNGAIGVAEACFEASYGYDVRGEILGSGGMATMGDGRRTGLTFFGAGGRTVETVRVPPRLSAWPPSSADAHADSPARAIAATVTSA